MLRWLVAATLLFCASFSRPALCDSSRLLLIDPDPELAAALEAGLRAWSTIIVVQRASGPGNAMPGSAEEARKRAARHRVQAVVWISSAPDGVALWIYDAQSDRVLARKLASPPPFDEATAASVALMVKTMLRHSQVPPPAERAEVVPPPRPPWLRASLHAGVRANATRPSGAELRLGVGGTVWPESLAGTPSLGFGLELDSGPGVDVDEPSFTGHWSEAALLLALHARFQLTGSFDLTIIPAGGLNLSRMTGVVSAPRDEVSSTRVSALAALHSELGAQVAPALRTALRLGVSSPARTQTYLVHGESVFRVNEPMLTALVLVEAGIF